MKIYISIFTDYNHISIHGVHTSFKNASKFCEESFEDHCYHKFSIEEWVPGEGKESATYYFTNENGWQIL